MNDISEILKQWKYSPDTVTVRIIDGDDQKPKIQMRLDLGLLQMEYEGRPDGLRPHGFESFLDYQQERLNQHLNLNGSEEGFVLDPDECASLRGESLQYYYRYLSLFHLKDFKAVERDTARNLKAFHFMKKYAAEEEDRFALEQYRPYVLMMNTRAKAYQLLQDNQLTEALDCVDAGIRKIKSFFKELGRPRLAARCSEMVILDKLIDEIKTFKNHSPVERLRKKMKDAVAQEDYERAAQIRDEIRKLTQTNSL
ncbi:MAG: UvrB/UvrC motif-containing protein [bacterium]|nr:UvrB/UvrC motif-containing protein [bacterium]